MFRNLWLIPGGWKLRCCSLCPSLLLRLHLLPHASAILLIFCVFCCFVLHAAFLFVYRDFQRFSWKCRCLDLHLQKKSCSKLRDKFGNWTYLMTTSRQNQEGDGGILGGCFAIPHHRHGVHIRQWLWGAKETSLSRRTFFASLLQANT